jgi:hypothetical protein
VAEWIARVYRTDRGYRVVVDGLTHFDVARLDDVEDATRRAILATLHGWLPRRSPAVPDPDAERVLEFEVAVRRVAREPAQGL